MNRIQTMTAFAALSLFASFSSAAQAQVALTNGATVSAGTITRTEPMNSLDLSVYGAPTSSSHQLISRAPMIQTFNGTSVGISFSGSSGVFNYPYSGISESKLTADRGAVNLDFSSVQNYFTLRWDSIDLQNDLAFYNGDQLVTSLNGTQLRSILGVTTYVTSVAEFIFAEVGFTKVVATSSSFGFEFDQVAFASDTVDVAPIPLNAASLGGLMSFLMMLAMRGKGGTQVAIRMALASLMPRRRVVA
jgi:hypothetical protein